MASNSIAYYSQCQNTLTNQCHMDAYLEGIVKCFWHFAASYTSHRYWAKQASPALKDH